MVNCFGFANEENMKEFEKLILGYFAVSASLIIIILSTELQNVFTQYIKTSAFIEMYRYIMSHVLLCHGNELLLVLLGLKLC